MSKNSKKSLNFQIFKRKIQKTSTNKKLSKKKVSAMVMTALQTKNGTLLGNNKSENNSVNKF